MDSNKEVKALEDAGSMESVGFQRPAAVPAKASKEESKKHRRRSVSSSPMKLRVRAGMRMEVTVKGGVVAPAVPAKVGLRGWR